MDTVIEQRRPVLIDRLLFMQPADVMGNPTIVEFLRGQKGLRRMYANTLRVMTVSPADLILDEYDGHFNFIMEFDDQHTRYCEEWGLVELSEYDVSEKLTAPLQSIPVGTIGREVQKGITEINRLAE